MIENIFQRHKDLLGEECLKKLNQSRILIAGVGGLGSNLAMILARLGVGNLTLMDPAVIDLPDLNRQNYYFPDLGKRKVEVTFHRLKDINPSLNISTISEQIDENFVLKDIDIVADCLDNFESRIILSRKAYKEGIPYVHAGVAQFFGQITVIIPGRTPKLEEIIPVNVSIIRQVISPVVMTAASISAMQIINIVCKKGKVLENEILTIDMLNMKFDLIKLNLK